MNLKTIIGLIVGFTIGIACSYFKIPLPAPGAILGSLIVAAITLGYLFVDKMIKG